MAELGVVLCSSEPKGVAEEAAFASKDPDDGDGAITSRRHVGMAMWTFGSAGP